MMSFLSSGQAAVGVIGTTFCAKFFMSLQRVQMIGMKKDEIKVMSVHVFEKKNPNNTSNTS
jgi:hypothetical protein